MSKTIKSAFLAIVFLASPLSLAAETASAAEPCRTAAGKPGPEGSRWYYRLEHPSLRKCWHLVLKGGKRLAAAPARQPVADDEAEPTAAAAPAPMPAAATPAERVAEPRKAEPVVRTLVTRNASNTDPAALPTDRFSNAAPVDDSANAPAPTEQATATEPAPAPVVETAPQRAAVAPAPTASEPRGTSMVSWLLAAVALLGSAICVAFIVIETRRRRTDVLNIVRNDEPLPGKASAEEHDDLRIDPATFAPLPALRATRHEDDVDLALRRFARRRAA